MTITLDVEMYVNAESYMGITSLLFVISYFSVKEISRSICWKNWLNDIIPIVRYENRHILFIPHSYLSFCFSRQIAQQRCCP